LESGSVRSIMERGFGELNAGIVSFSRHGSNPAAAEDFRRAIHWFTQAQRREPDSEEFRTQLANAYAWLADVQFKAGEYAASLSAQTQSERLKRQLAEADPRNLDKYFNLLVAERALALTRYRLGEHATARAELARLATLTTTLEARDPEKWEWGYIADKTKADLAELN